MTWTTPKEFTGSEVLTTADLNTYLSDNTEYLYDSAPATTGFLNKGTVWVDQANQRIESGIEDTLYTTINYGSTAVTFNTAFGTAPRVMVTPTSGAFGYAFSIGTGGFNIYTSMASGTYSGTITAHWLAIGA